MRRIETLYCRSADHEQFCVNKLNHILLGGLTLRCWGATSDAIYRPMAASAIRVRDPQDPWTTYINIFLTIPCVHNRLPIKVMRR